MLHLKTSYTDMDPLLSVLNYTLKILLQKYPLTLFPVISTLYCIHQHRHRRKVLTCMAVPAELHEELIPDNIRQTLHGDVDTCVLANLDVINKFACGSDVAWFQLAQRPPANFNKKIVVKAIGIPGVETSTVIVTETMHLNIKNQLMIAPHTDDFKVTLDNVGIIFDSPDISCLFVPSIATKASIGLLQSPFDIDNEILDIILGNYFETPHYLCCGDLFSVDVFKYAPHLRYSIFLQSTQILFKVLDIEGPENKLPSQVECGYFVMKDFTTVTQSPNQQGFLPRCTHFFCDMPTGSSLTSLNLKAFLLSNCPSGLSVFYDELAMSIRPFLHYAHLKMHGVRPVFLIYGPKGAGKQKVINSIGKAFGVNVWSVDCLDLKGTAPGYTAKKIQIIFKKVRQLVPCIVMLRNIDILCKDHEGNDDSRIISAFHDQLTNLYEEIGGNHALPVIVLGSYNTTNKNTSAIAPSLAREFLHVMHLGSPNEAQRTEILTWILRKCNVMLHPDVSIKHIAARSSGFLYEDLKALVSHAVRFRCKAYKHLAVDEENCVMPCDFDGGLDFMHAAYSGAIGAPKIPAVLWNDIGGLLPLKEEIKRTITMPLQHPELVASGLRRSGILLYGPPGTGKTLLAKAVATECNLNFLSVKGPELLNMYVGQSEENVREVFDRARAASPCIIFFDELDSLAPNRGRSGDSAGVMDRVVSQLLAEMDGMQKSTHLYVIGATNRPDLIDPALLRPGRFDKLLYVGICEDHESQYSVLTALTRRFHMSPGMNLHDVVALLPKNLTGADIFSVSSNAWLNAVKKCIRSKENGDSENVAQSSAVVVNIEDFSAAIEKLAPSVTAEDLAYFHQLHQKLATK